MRFAALLLAMIAVIGASTAWARPEIPAEPSPTAMRIKLVYLGKRYPEPPPLSLLEKILTDEGVQGARLAVIENNRTGRLIDQHFELDEAIVGAGEDVVSKARSLMAAGERLIVADLEPDDLMAVADMPEARSALLLNVRSSNDKLRQENCRNNVFHILPNWAMRADALAQYLVWKKWQKWFLITGSSTPDKEYAEALRRAAKKFGAKIVEDKQYAFDAGSRRTDTGHQQIQTQMPLLTQSSADHDVIVVADVGEAFGDYLMYRTFEPRPVVGTQGLVAVAWHRSFEQYAGTQLQNRFERQAGRIMTERDYAAWLAVRVFGEAVTRTGKTDARIVEDYLMSREFEVAGFKGMGMTFRAWDHQLRQPILISGPRALVSISPQDGFLHQRFLTDTMGFDEPETLCKMTRTN